VWPCGFWQTRAAEALGNEEIAEMSGNFERLALLVRRRVPPGLRRLLRLVRHLLVKGQPSPPVPSELMADCKMCASRQELVCMLPPKGRIAEVGSWRGHFAKHILFACEPAELHLVDLDFSQLDPALAIDAHVMTHRGVSHEVLAGFPEGYFDWIYVDGDHSYSGVSRDANAAATKVKPGGYLVFNDFSHIDPFLGTYGVHRAVVEFAIARRWTFAWFAYEVHGQYDVALRRPMAD